MPYQEILSRAWQIFKRQRALWLFGFLSACTGGTYGRIAFPGFNFQIPSFPHDGAAGAPPQPLPPDAERWLSKLSTIPPHVWLLIGLGLLVLLLAWAVIVLLVRGIADPSLIRGALRSADSGQTLTVAETFAEGKRFFWRAVGFYLLVGGGAAVLAFMVFAVGTSIALFTLGLGLLCLLPLLLLAIPFTWLVELYLEITLLALAVEDLPLLNAFSRGWEVLKSNFWNAVLMGLLLTVIHWGVGLAIGIIFVILAVPTFGPLIGFGIALQGHDLALLMIIGFLFLAALLLIVAALDGLLQTYLQSAWVLAYRHFTAQPPEPESAAPPADAAPAPEAP